MPAALASTQGDAFSAEGRDREWRGATGHGKLDQLAIAGKSYSNMRVAVIGYSGGVSLLGQDDRPPTWLLDRRWPSHSVSVRGFARQYQPSKNFYVSRARLPPLTARTAPDGSLMISASRSLLYNEDREGEGRTPPAWETFG
jgi:hypothetical protein